MRRPAVFLILAALVGASNVAAANVRNATSPIVGRWHWTWTRDELLRVDQIPFDVKTLDGPEVLVFANGRYHARNLRTGRIDAGRLTVNGYVVTFIPTFTSVPGVGRRPGQNSATMTFSIYRDRLIWKRVPGRYGWDILTITPWTRST